MHTCFISNMICMHTCSDDRVSVLKLCACVIELSKKVAPEEN